jgi:hypothetical protein
MLGRCAWLAVTKKKFLTTTRRHNDTTTQRYYGTTIWRHNDTMCTLLPGRSGVLNVQAAWFCDANQDQAYVPVVPLCRCEKQKRFIAF